MPTEAQKKAARSAAAKKGAATRKRNQAKSAQDDLVAGVKETGRALKHVAEAAGKTAKAAAQAVADRADAEKTISRARARRRG